MSESHKKQKIDQNQYTGYTIPSSTTTVPTIDLSSSQITPKDFFDTYISKRKPVKLVNNTDSKKDSFIDIDKFKLKNIQTTLNYNDEFLQVEEMFQGGFGSGQKRIDMMFGDLVEEFKNGGRELYLTTQYDREGEDDKEDEEVEEEEDDDDEDDDDEEQNEEAKESEEEEDGEEEGPVLFDQMSNASSIDMNGLHDDFDDFNDESTKDSEYEAYQRVKTLYQPPLTNLAKSLSSPILPTNPPLIPNLIPQQINIWMGKISPSKAQFSIDTSKPLTQLDRSIPQNGTSSGLHHDHADNLYILIQGRKRFTIYSPCDALKLYTVGQVYKIFQNGVIDYETSQEFPNWRSIRDDGAIIEEVLNWQISQTEDEAEINRLNELLEIQETKRRKIGAQRKDSIVSEELSQDPPSFSKIPPCLLHIDEVEDIKQQEKLIEFANTHFPGFLQLNQMTVWLNSGEMLYLPASWFHEVSSFGTGNQDDEENTGVHIALNYWFVPPNTDDFENCYKDQYWEQDWQQTKTAIDVFANAVKVEEEEQEEE
ncbi:hypothetical protein I9W82_004140 [Candida metapsilosis]|uniref:JmjC domain-containing protein n=1 Tax=Candida metapsilosis TaxID=273372 RepID=A0A8H8DAW1_9ASCO|nr:hypothetical protein I9W82_004140 [Candida metapsilosis]